MIPDTFYFPRIGNRLFLSIVVSVLGFQGNAWAETFPRYTVDAMCDKADVIIEGTYLGKNKVRINQIHKPSMLLKKETKMLEVSKLKEHSRTLWNGFSKKGARLKANKLVLFLVHKEDTATWESITTIDDGRLCGSCGLFWFDDSTCYGYMQVINPGPYVLLPAKRSEWRMPKSIDSLRSDIETGLANSREWRRSLAIKDRTEKAEALSRYLLKSTSPKGDKGTYLYAVLEPMAALGKNSVGTLIQILRTAPAGENLNPTVLILYSIGQPAAPAVPDLIALLSKPDRVHTEYVLSALGSTGDPRAEPHLKRYLESEDKRLTDAAREALEMYRKRRLEMGN